MHHFLSGLLIAAGGALRFRKEAAAPPTSPQALAELSNHHLRDIGIVRERMIDPRRHLLWL